MAGTVVDAAGQFNHSAPRVVKRAGFVDEMPEHSRSSVNQKRFWRDPVKDIGMWGI
jgi:hypothetical protein